MPKIKRCQFCGKEVDPARAQKYLLHGYLFLYHPKCFEEFLATPEPLEAPLPKKPGPRK